jgi:hypothetical protein
MISHRHHSPRMRSELYRDNYRRLLRILVLVCVIIACLTVSAIYLMIAPPKAQYYVSATSGRLYQWCDKQNIFLEYDRVSSDGGC